MTLHENVLPMEPHRALVRTDRCIGALLVEEGKLTPREVDRVLDRQRKEHVRFGEAAVRLGYISEDDVRFALAKQYDMPHFTPASEGPSRELVAAFAPFHPRTEELRALRTQLLIRWYAPDQGRKSLVITSADAREGRSYLASNLAIVFSQLGARTLLVDADLRKPRQHLVFALPEGQGLSTLLAGRSDHKSTFPVPGMSRLSVLPAGPLPPNPQELLSRPVFAAFMKDLQAIYDVIIIDTPPARQYADAQNVAYRAGDALVVARKNHTSVATTQKVIRDLAGTGARVVGTVVNEY
ncbi:MAG TPA: chain length determinant protein tyrosine kinase EpsG [Usitatibacter sp.]|jgi:receptor protein-tyrosine kinase|nr:chain length determinant protein tyrosine kinase EpsG [Usitatibacter sp.]